MRTFYIYKLNLTLAEDGSDLFGENSKNSSTSNLKNTERYFKGLFTTVGAETTLHHYQAMGA